jgi:hypothetical protein
MCHGYEMKWWKSESKATRTAKESPSEVIRTLAAQQDEKAKAAPDEKVEEKVLVPAE